MGILKARKNKKYSYSPRYYEGSSTPFKLESKFDKYRKATLETKGLKAKFTTAWDDFRYNNDKRANRTTILILAVLVMLFLFIIDFDLSIFTQF
ncbi:riboflavin synthase subunit beta [Leeuwenhoekiella sp. W20_SRS_FM14]|uniref:riboflavin synthase subunit beta n=1 Tax=Leeuwenhoekiella sp. W20_SRS_FM14 TaxID=3240270 RepID=UPI003F9AE391